MRGKYLFENLVQRNVDNHPTFTKKDSVEKTKWESDLMIRIGFCGLD